MRAYALCTATAVALLAFSTASFAQSGSRIAAPPSTGSNADVAGAAGTTTPRSSSPSDSGGAGPTSPGTIAGPTAATCDNLTGPAREQCLRQSTSPSGSAGAGSTGMSRGSTGSGPAIGGGATPGTGSGRR